MPKLKKRYIQRRTTRRIILFSMTISLFLALLKSQKRNQIQKNTKDALISSSNQGSVLVTASNYMYREQLRNFQCSISRLNLSYSPVVFSLDLDTHDFVSSRGFVSVPLSTERGDDVQPGNFQKKGPRSFNDITRKKFSAVQTVLNVGLNVLVSDADIHWCSDALGKIISLGDPYSSADIIVMAESGYRTLNSGFYFVRANELTKEVFETMADNSNFGHHDQDVFNAVLCGENFGAKKVDNLGISVPYHCITKNGAEVRVLDAQKWPSGAQKVDDIPIFSRDRDELENLCSQEKIHVIHNNFIIAKKKKSRMVVKGMWFLDDEHTMDCLRYPYPATSKYVKTCGPNC